MNYRLLNQLASLTVLTVATTAGLAHMPGIAIAGIAIYLINREITTT